MQPLLALRTTAARRAPILALVVALFALPTSIVLAFTYAPNAVIALEGTGESQIDFPQKIFYVHVPIAFAAYLGFAVGAWNGLLYLIRGATEYDVRSYVGVHVGMVFGTLVLITGSLWAKAAWGVWWSWGDRQLLVFLTLFLYYAAYFMLRFSIDAGQTRARASAVCAVLGVVLVPFSFLAVRIADTLIHPTVITSRGLEMTSEMGTTFIVAIVGFLSLAIAMMHLEATSKLVAARRAR